MGLSGSTPVGPPSPLSAADFLNRDPAAISKFLAELRDRGVVIFALDDGQQQVVQDYLGVGKRFFALPQASKEILSQMDELAGKKNKGYVHVNGVKEFLKLTRAEADQLPSQLSDAIPDLGAKAKHLHELFLSIASLGFSELAAHVPEGSNSPYMDPALKEAVLPRISQRSSVSYIHYLPREAPENRTGDAAAQQSSALDENGLNVPSKLHTDTGIMTMILCNDVPGLLVENRHATGEADKFYQVETMFQPYKFLFCILGNKIELLSLQRETALRPTVHKVAIPYGIERYSLLYFVDVPQ